MKRLFTIILAVLLLLGAVAPAFSADSLEAGDGKSTNDEADYYPEETIPIDIVSFSPASGEIRLVYAAPLDQWSANYPGIPSVTFIDPETNETINTDELTDASVYAGLNKRIDIDAIRANGLDSLKGSQTFTLTCEVYMEDGRIYSGSKEVEFTVTSVSTNTPINDPEAESADVADGNKSESNPGKADADTSTEKTDAAQSQATADSSSTTSPKTGDNTKLILWIALMVISLAACCITIVIYKRKVLIR